MIVKDKYFTIGECKVKAKLSGDTYYLSAASGSNKTIYEQFGIQRKELLLFPECHEERGGDFPYFKSLQSLNNVVEFLKSHECKKPLNHLIKTILKQC